MDYFTKFFAFPNTRVDAMNSDISIYTGYRGFPRNTRLPSGALPHVFESFIKHHVNTSTICRGEIGAGYISRTLSNMSTPTMMKILLDNKTKKIVGLTIGHKKGEDLYIDLLCAMERKKSEKQHGFGSILMKEIKKEGSILNVNHVLLEPVDTAYGFYIKKGFEPRKGMRNRLEFKVPKMSPSVRNTLLSQGMSAVRRNTTTLGSRIQTALKRVPNKTKTAKVVPKTPNKPNILPAIASGTTRSGKRIQNTLASIKNPKKLPPLLARKTPSSSPLSIRKKLSPILPPIRIRTPKKSPSTRTPKKSPR